MSTDNIITLIAAGLAFIASLIAVAVSANNTRFVRFTSEKWWERKVEAYVRIIGALSDLVYYYQQTYNAKFKARELPKERQREIEAHWKKGYLEIRKATNVGAFLISPKAEKALEEYWERPKGNVHPDDWFGQRELDYISAEKCLKELVICAKKDLRVRL